MHTPSIAAGGCRLCAALSKQRRIGSHQDVSHDFVPDGVQVGQALVELLGERRVRCQLAVQLAEGVGESPAFIHQSTGIVGYYLATGQVLKGCACSMATLEHGDCARGQTPSYHSQKGSFASMARPRWKVHGLTAAVKWTIQGHGLCSRQGAPT